MDSELARDGYVVLRGLLDGGHLEMLRRQVAAAPAPAAMSSCERPHNTLVPLRWNDPPVHALLRDSTLVSQVARAAGGVDLRWTSAYLSVKEPQSLALWWHQDWWCWDHPVSLQRDPPQVALLIYLTDTTTRTGALRVLPGSHARSHALHAVLPAAHRDPAASLDPSHPCMADQPDQRTIEAVAGDAVLLDYRILHATHPNVAPMRRDCLILNFTPSWRDLPEDVRAHLIGGLGLPTAPERPAAAQLAVLPPHEGPIRDLALNRNAPQLFALP